jgi:hypothetical protein
MAAGTSSPALFLSLIALLQPSATDDTGAGTIVGERNTKKAFPFFYFFFLTKNVRLCDF